MQEVDRKYEELVCSFKTTWDEFPGAARLVDKSHVTIAVNRFASEHGMEAGQICAKLGTPESHKGCLKAKSLQEGKGMMDRPLPNKIRGWIPIEGYPDVVVHFALEVPEVNQ